MYCTWNPRSQVRFWVTFSVVACPKRHQFFLDYHKDQVLWICPNSPKALLGKQAHDLGDINQLTDNLAFRDVITLFWGEDCIDTEMCDRPTDEISSVQWKCQTLEGRGPHDKSWVIHQRLISLEFVCWRPFLALSLPGTYGMGKYRQGTHQSVRFICRSNKNSSLSYPKESPCSHQTRSWRLPNPTVRSTLRVLFPFKELH
jgi:hypothetical protein